MTKSQEKQLKDLYFTVRAYLNELDPEDADRLYYEIEKYIADISRWIKEC